MSKPNDEYNWTNYTLEYSTQLKHIKEQDKQDFFITEFSIDPKYLNIRFSEKDNLHQNWKELYHTAYQVRPKSVFECGCGGGYHLQNLHLILQKDTIIGGCDLLQTQLSYAEGFSTKLPQEVFDRLQVLDLAQEIEVEKQYEFVFSHAVVMHLSTSRAYTFLQNMKKLSSKYVFLVEGVKNHENWYDMVKEVFPEAEWNFELTSRYIDYGILLTKRLITPKINPTMENNTATTPLTHEQEVVFNKQLRKNIDEIIQQVKAATPSRERSLAITKLQEGVMWLGMDLKRQGEANPYPSSKDPSTGSVVEPTADGLKM